MDYQLWVGVGSEPHLTEYLSINSPCVKKLIVNLEVPEKLDFWYLRVGEDFFFLSMQFSEEIK